MKTTDNSLTQMERQPLSRGRRAAQLLAEFSRYIFLAILDFFYSDIFELGCFLIPASHWDEDLEMDQLFIE
jgi:hypothetical protein